jgi:UDP-N-acetylglucosamine--N-acetylmuramyl-(pentapeptide) pyrophosphoryl-undecaprenol N-acetylglucosamine transferase
MAGRVLFVASTGGHLEQLYQMHSSLAGASDSATWVTFDSSQSRSLLEAESDVIYIGRVASRGYRDLVRTLWPAWRILRRVRPDTVYSTGAAIALAFLPFAWLVRARAVYVESAARTNGPSLTGRLLRLLPWIQLRTQYRNWATKRWNYAGSVFDGYVAVPTQTQSHPIRRVLVTLGTQEGYPFVSLVERMQQIVPDGVEVMWQIGEGFPEGQRPLGAREMITRAELSEWVDSADAIVTHAGVGSALTLLQSGRTPVLVPRSASRGEHIDEHQQLIANELAMRGLAVSVSSGELTWDDLIRSTTTTTQRTKIIA